MLTVVSDLGSRFIQAHGEPIELDGRLVHMSHLMTLPTGVLKLWMRPTRDLEQGVGISADGGWLIVNGEKSKRFALWTSTAPECVEIAVKPLRGREHLSVRVWKSGRATAGARRWRGYRTLVCSLNPKAIPRSPSMPALAQVARPSMT